MEGNEVNPADLLTEEQRTRIERNRERARTLRQARLASHPYGRANSDASLAATPVTTKVVVQEDTHGGFLIEEEETARAPTYRIVEEVGEAMWSCAVWGVGLCVRA